MDETPTGTQYPAAPARNPYAIPAAIVLGFTIIAAAIYFGGNNTPSPLGANTQPPVAAETAAGPIAPVTADDHIRGNPNAPIMIVEFADYDCPFCKNFHDTMKQVMDNYGAAGQVAWVYRHFPLDQLHPSAHHIAVAAECVADIAGSDAFWTFSDLVFDERGTNEPTNIARLGEFAATAGAPATEFQSCLDSGRTVERVDADIADAVGSGANGTPHSVVIIGDQQGVINGAQPYSVVSQIIETLLAQRAGQEPAADAEEGA